MFQLSQLNGEAVATNSVSISFKVEASAPPQEPLWVMVFAPHQRAITLDGLEVKDKEVLDQLFSINYPQGVPVSSAQYKLKQGNLLSLEASPQQLSAGEFKFRLNKTDWEGPVHIALAREIKGGKRSSYVLVSNVLNNGR
jgi:hypothetical protein